LVRFTPQERQGARAVLPPVCIAVTAAQSAASMMVWRVDQSALERELHGKHCEHSPLLAFEERRKRMASSHFDELTRVIARSTSRRQAIKAVVVGTLGGVLSFSGVRIAGAVGCLHSGRCKHDNDCCSKVCRFTSTGGDFFCG
jgi:hypothetical protein